MTGSRPAVLIEGDGVGPEIIAATLEVLEAVDAPFEWRHEQAGMAAYLVAGRTVSEATLDAIRETGVALKGPFETPSGGDIRSANFYIRRDLDLFACLRPVRVRQHEILLVRENVEDLYGAAECWIAPDTAVALKVATRAGCERVARFAFELATRQHRSKVTLVHKANNLKLTEGLFLDVAREVAAEHPDVVFDDLLADTAGSQLVLQPETFDVLLTNNSFGDVLSNVAAAVAGSLGLVPSINLGNDIAVSEPSHGSAPDLAGTGRANPIAAILAGALLLDEIGLSEPAGAMREAVRSLEAEGLTTPDLGGVATTAEVGAETARRARAALAPKG